MAPTEGHQKGGRGGGGDSTAKVFKGKYEDKLAFPEGRESLKRKTFHRKGMGILILLGFATQVP